MKCFFVLIAIFCSLYGNSHAEEKIAFVNVPVEEAELASVKNVEYPIDGVLKEQTEINEKLDTGLRRQKRAPLLLAKLGLAKLGLLKAGVVGLGALKVAELGVGYAPYSYAPYYRGYSDYGGYGGGYGGYGYGGGYGGGYGHSSYGGYGGSYNSYSYGGGHSHGW